MVKYSSCSGVGKGSFVVAVVVAVVVVVVTEDVCGVKVDVIDEVGPTVVEVGGLVAII
jgi:hypothetical protein